jgi:uncharacterized damage-inducible protein DinB
MAEDREGLLEHYRRSREDLLSAIDGLSEAQLTERSLDGWSVTDHLAHLATWDEVRATEVARISAGFGSLWRMSDMQDAAYNEMAYDLRKAMSPAQARWELETSRGALLEAIASASDRGLDPTLYGEAGLTSGHEAEHTGWIRRWRNERGI